MTRILITGVRGKTGAPLAERLAGPGGVDVLGGSSDPSTVTIDGVRPTGLSWDGTRVAWIDTRDIAAVAERVLLEPGHEGRVYELSGPQALTLPHTAQLLSRALGRPVAQVELTVDEAVTGLEGFDRHLSAATFERLHGGLYAEVTDTVERVTGRPARTLQAFLADLSPITEPGSARPS